MVTQELAQLLALQETDTALADVSRHEEEAHTRLRDGKGQLERFKEQMAAEKKQLDEALKEHKSLDLDLKKFEDQTKKYSTQIYEVKTNKEYTALKDEIDRGKAECQKLEDKILQLMLREDELKGTAGRRNAELKEKTDGWKRTEEEVGAALGQLTSERETLNAGREERGGRLSPRLLERYDRIRRLRGGSALSRVVEAPTGGEAACGECHMTIRPQMIVEISKQEELVACESCGRILYLETSVDSATALQETPRDT